MARDPEAVALEVRDLCQRTLVRRLKASERAETDLADPEKRVGFSARERSSLEAEIVSTADVVRIMGEHEDRFGQPRRTHTHVKNEGLTPVLIKEVAEWPPPIGGPGAAAPAGGAHGAG